MDGLFIGSPSGAGALLTGLSLPLIHHSARLSRYEKCYRERQKLIQTGAEAGWIEALETQLGEIGVAIMARARSLLCGCYQRQPIRAMRPFGFPAVTYGYAR